MNLLIAKAYHTTSNEALRILEGTTPNIIKAEEAAKRYDIWNRHIANVQKIDQELGLNQWPQPSDFINIPETKGCDDQTIQNYTDFSKGEREVGGGVVIFVNNELIARHKFRFKNQAEKLSIVKALDLIKCLEIAGNKPHTIGVYTDSRNTINSLKNASNRNYFIEEIRNM